MFDLHRIAGGVLAWTLLGGFGSFAAVAQTDAILTGTVYDASRAVVPGATVTVLSPQLIGGPRTIVSEPDGTFRFAALAPGIYELTAERSGFQSVRRAAIRLPAGATIVVDVELSPASVTDVLIVQGRSPMVDVRSAAAPTRLDQDLLFNLPTNRSMASLINLTPGVSADVAFGGSQKSNEILVEGVRTTEALFQDPVTRFNYNWVQEMNVVALAASAEHGGFTGAAANAILRSGSNRFSGLGEYWTTRPSWLAENTQELSDRLRKQFNSRELVEWWDSSAQLGGPILRDRLWFFSGIQYARHNDRPAGVSAGSRNERDVQVLVRPSAALSPALRIDGFVERGTFDVDGEYLGVDTPMEFTNVVTAPQTSWNSRATWTPRANTLVEVRHGGFTWTSSGGPRPPNTPSGPPARYDYGRQVLTQGGWEVFNQESTQHSTSAALTRYIDRGRGRSHDFKVGFEYEVTDARQEYGYPGGRFYYDYYGEPSEIEIWDGDASNAATRRSVVFGQDTWAIGDRLTLHPGARLEFNRGRVPLKGNVFATNTFSPRIGLAWEVTRDHRTVARVHYGRYHDTIFASRIMQADRSERTPYVYALVVGPEEFVELSRNNNDRDAFGIDKNLRHSYVDQFVAGVEHELMSDLSVEAQYIRRRFDTFMGLIDTGSRFDPVERRDPGPDNRLNTADDGDLLTLFNVSNPGNQFLLYTNPKEAFNRYDAVQVVARKRYTRNSQLQASYTWSKNRGTVGNRWHVNAARFDLGAPGRFVDPNFFINAYGRATFDPTHEAKILGTYRIPLWNGFNLSAVYRYTTGQAWGRRTRFTGLRQGQRVVRIEPQGTRRLPAINRLDLRAEKTLTLRGRTIGLFFDAFNLTNQGVPDSDRTNAVVDFSGDRFGEPDFWVDPRMLRVGIRFTF